jgi:arabinose-5-phosphate isomerase
MKSYDKIVDAAINTIRLEAEAVKLLEAEINEDFVNVVKQILSSSGRLVITGIGKSAIISQKIVATLNSTGTPSIYMHAADAIHGDLGLIQQNDIVICISKSGNTPEIKALIPLIKSMGNVLVGLTSNKTSSLGQSSNYVLLARADKEACPNNLAPTTSTTTQLVMGDALAVALMKTRGFTDNDFAKYHPGGALGKKLFITVGDVIKKDEAPLVYEKDILKTIIVEISSKRLGATVVLDNNDFVCGVITDGDIRRMLENEHDFYALKATDVMSKNPKTISDKSLAVEAFNIMESHKITQLIVVDEHNKYKGIIHLHDILKEGIF